MIRDDDRYAPVAANGIAEKAAVVFACMVGALAIGIGLGRLVTANLSASTVTARPEPTCAVVFDATWRTNCGRPEWECKTVPGDARFTMCRAKPRSVK